jgi:hypothetical protein
MSRITKQEETAAAIEEALHELGWEHLGVTDGGASNWFIRGYKPKQVRIEVVKSRLADHMVLVNVEWINLAFAPEVKRGRQTLQVDASKGRSPETFGATMRAVERCLQIYLDVVSGKGVASNRVGQEITTAEVTFTTEEDDGGNPG